MDFLSELYNIYDKENIFTDEPMNIHTTFRAGGPAKYLVKPALTSHIIDTIRLCRKYDVPYTVVGNGSNILVSDKGYDGLVILISDELGRVEVNGKRITAGAGAMLSKVANAALKASLKGMEFAAGIPGTVGGACVMNAGAYGGEIKDVIVSAKAVDRDGNILDFTVDEMELSYRHSIFADNEYIIVEAVFELEEGDVAEISSIMKELAAKRREKQPLEYPSAGSTFKRPTGYFAGALIEEAGLKGRGVGGARVSEKHAGFVINYDNATAADILDTINLVKEEVAKKSSVMLECEIKFLGMF